MARRSGFVEAVSQAKRDAQQRQAAEIRAQQQALKAAERSRRELARAQAANEKERQRLYVEARIAEVESDNEVLRERVLEIQNLLVGSLGTEHEINFESLRQKFEPPDFEPGQLGVAESPPDPEKFKPAAPTGVAKLIPRAKKKFAEDFERSRQAHELAAKQHAERELHRHLQLDLAQKEHAAKEAQTRENVEAHNTEVEKFAAAYKQGDPDSVISYVALVLERSSFPEGFPVRSRLAYVPESKQLVIEFDLPDFSIVPEVASYRYVKTGDKRTDSARPATQRKKLYLSIVAQVALRVLHEAFSSDQGGFIETVVFNGHVDTIDPGTGRSIRPCLVTVRTTSDAFKEIELSKVDPVVCLKTLNAGVSPSPAELSPVRPVLEFSMVDARFVEEQDVLASLDQRPNLMDLTPSEFESLITNLFQAMGLETKLTQASRDGGVDCVAYDPRPILGGKVVIQAKRYKNTVGVSAVRDLYGTMVNEGAAKGLLVTTSGYGKASFDFAADKPLELLDGSNLLYLLAEHAGIEAKIEPPDDWKDPDSDQ